jgi:hypothetical protein
MHFQQRDKSQWLTDILLLWADLTALPTPSCYREAAMLTSSGGKLSKVWHFVEMCLYF